MTPNQQFTISTTTKLSLAAQLRAAVSSWSLLLGLALSLLAACCNAQAGFFQAPPHPFYIGGGAGMGSIYWNRVKGVADDKTIKVLNQTIHVSSAIFMGAPSEAGGYGFAYSFYGGYYVNPHFAIQFDYTHLPTTKVVLPESTPAIGENSQAIHDMEAAAKFQKKNWPNAYHQEVTDLAKRYHLSYDQVDHLLQYGDIPSAYPACKQGNCIFHSKAYAFDVVAKFITPIMRSRYSAFASIGPAWTFRNDAFAHRNNHIGAAFGVGLGATLGTRWLTTLEYDYRTGSEKSSLTPVYDYLPYNASLLLTTAFRL